MQLIIKHFSCIMFVAPSCSGKSTLASMITAQAKAAGVPSVTFSADAIRQELLGPDVELRGNMESPAQLVSAEAFGIFFKRFEEAITYPNNVPLVLLDTTALMGEFREEVKELCEKHHYTLQIVVLNPVKAGVMLSMRLNALEYHIPVYLAHHDKLQSSNLLTTKGVTVITKNVRSADFVLTTSFPDLEMYNKCRVINPHHGIAIIGDVHERLEELLLLITQLKDKYPDIVIYLLGDFIDKGNNTFGIIDYLLAHPETNVVIGNHDSYVKGVLATPKFTRAPLDIEQEYFTSVEVLLGNEKYTKKYLQVMERVIPFLEVYSGDIHVFATHAPCPTKYLGKLDNESRKNQRNKRFNREESTLSQLDFVFEEADKHQDLYLFGHVMVDHRSNTYKRIMAIDSGAYLGNPLTAFAIFPDGTYDVVSQESVLDVSLRSSKELIKFPS